MDNLFKMVKIPDVKIESISNVNSAGNQLNLDYNPIQSLGNLEKVEGELILEEPRKED